MGLITRSGHDQVAACGWTPAGADCQTAPRPRLNRLVLCCKHPFFRGSRDFILGIMKSSIERAARAVIGYRETRNPLDRGRYSQDFLQHA